jgi:L-ribulose-5-phosphate 3-epimerase
MATMTSRRDFLATAALAGAAAAAPAAKDQISLAAWSINRSFFVNHRWKNLDLPRICREQLGIGGLEFVNQFFDLPLIGSLNQLNRAAKDYNVALVRIMVDDEGNMAAVDRKERMTAAVAHRKWVDIAHYLNCRDIRCNMRGGPREWKQDPDIAKRAAESFHDLLEYAKPSGLDIIIENHGGASSDPEILTGLMKAVDNPRFGILPDFGNVNPGDDHAAVLRKLLPYARGVSVKAAWAPDGTSSFDVEKLIRVCQEFGFHGWWGIESNYGRRRVAGAQQQEKLTPDEQWANELKGIQLTKALLERTVFKSA